MRSDRVGDADGKQLAKCDENQRGSARMATARAARSTNQWRNRGR
jgi:hypothetical protein